VPISPRVDFTSVLHAAYMCADYKSAKKTDSLTAFFALLELASIKAALKTFID